MLCCGQTNSLTESCKGCSCWLVAVVALLCLAMEETTTLDESHNKEVQSGEGVGEAKGTEAEQASSSLASASASAVDFDKESLIIRRRNCLSDDGGTSDSGTSRGSETVSSSANSKLVRGPTKFVLLLGLGSLFWLFAFENTAFYLFIVASLLSAATLGRSWIQLTLLDLRKKLGAAIHSLRSPWSVFRTRRVETPPPPAPPPSRRRSRKEPKQNSGDLARFLLDSFPYREKALFRKNVLLIGLPGSGKSSYISTILIAFSRRVSAPPPSFPVVYCQPVAQGETVKPPPALAEFQVPGTSISLWDTNWNQFNPELFKMAVEGCVRPHPVGGTCVTTQDTTRMISSLLLLLKADATKSPFTKEAYVDSLQSLSPYYRQAVELRLRVLFLVPFIGMSSNLGETYQQTKANASWKRIRETINLAAVELKVIAPESYLTILPLRCYEREAVGSIYSSANDLLESYGLVTLREALVPISSPLPESDLFAYEPGSTISLDLSETLQGFPLLD